MKKSELKSKTIIGLVFIIIIVLIYSFGVTSSKYIGQLKGDIKDIVAIPVLSLDNPSFNYAPEKAIPGYVGEADFYVSNYDESNTNEVLMKYYLNITTEGDLPLKYTIYKEDDKPITIVGNKSEEFELSYSNKKKTKYHLKVQWDKNDNNYEYATKTWNLKIDLVATQVTEET